MAARTFGSRPLARCGTDSAHDQQHNDWWRQSSDGRDIYSSYGRWHMSAGIFRTVTNSWHDRWWRHLQKITKYNFGPASNGTTYTPNLITSISSSLAIVSWTAARWTLRDETDRHDSSTSCSLLTTEGKGHMASTAHTAGHKHVWTTILI